MPPSILARQIGFSILRLNADKATGGGGDKSKTDLEKLQDAESEVKALKADLEAEAGKVATLEADKTALANQLLEEQGKVTKLTSDKAALEAEVTTLKNTSKTADQKAQELAAAHNSNAAGAGKGKEEAEAAGGQPDGKSHYDAYQAAMKAGDNLKATEIWNTHIKAITAYVATIK